MVQRPEPGDAAEKDAAQRRRVRFFDDTAASVHRHDLVPYREYRDALSKAKKSVGFVTAVRLVKPLAALLQEKMQVVLLGQFHLFQAL